ncbi:MAG: histidinol dehydrogenase [Chloroflexota bacterium]|nr:MAG: histidinol dehydrogenase [Chloroflexota bacterium]
MTGSLGTLAHGTGGSEPIRPTEPDATAAPDGTTLTRLDLRAMGAFAVNDPRVRALASRGAVPDRAVRDGARDILAAVQERGSSAVIELGRRHGGGMADGGLVIRRDELARAAAELDPVIRAAVDAAIANVRRFAATQRPSDTVTSIVPGVDIERRWVPVQRVGAYVPGGGAAYPSSLIMTVVPAQVAGVESIVVATPAASDGIVDAVLLGTAGVLGVDALIVAGGAQAIGALAFGLADLDIDPVDLIVGPGNAWVTAAKLELAGRTAIDLPAGPSEGMVIATPPADPDRVAADLLTQAEHGPDSPALLVTTDVEFADAVERSVRTRVGTAPRAGVLREALARHGRIVLVADVEAAVAIANAYAPEHLSIDVPDLEAAVRAIRNAGSVFVGPWAPESAGDYATGANHVLPTGGLARGCGPLAVETYGKFMQVQRISRDGLAALRPTIGTLATAEGLFAHREAVEMRFSADTTKLTEANRR